ncbi:FAD-dependent oxidoreductase [Micromonospora sp. WMMA1363]|uniref:NAD(P)/FAD-dependent oxidoreductase n=1 Tax=Micromonospora sp. WMMA1363 TaxID=3053985 RepID=UPI00259CE6EE|nr:FAD-dependent oxidoreductase [Micromonospora sp. WMMA1363]MDM4719455.1 FAD-dependent oxidoreductase [Micromonospora sp. WMMA1363]
MPSSPSALPDFALVGGGIVGACLAEELSGQGASVLVLDSGTESGHATNRAAGVAVPSLRYLNDREFYGWLRAAKLDLDADVARLEPRYGAFSVARPVLRALREPDIDTYGGLLDEVGVGTWIAGDELAAATTGLKLPPSRRYLLAEDGLMVDGRGYLDAVLGRCRDQGVTWQQGCTVREVREDGRATAIRTDDGTLHADRVVVTAGAWSSGKGLAESTGVRPQRGQMAVLRTEETLTCILSSAYYLAPGVGDDVIVGATEEDAGFVSHVTTEGIGQLLRFATTAMPGLADSVPVELRAGLRPVSDTGRPVAGAVPGHDRVFVLAGHAGHGLLSARMSAKGMAAGLLADDWDALPRSMCPAHARGGVA